MWACLLQASVYNVWAYLMHVCVDMLFRICIGSLYVHVCYQYVEARHACKIPAVGLGLQRHGFRAREPEERGCGACAHQHTSIRVLILEHTFATSQLQKGRQDSHNCDENKIVSRVHHATQWVPYSPRHRALQICIHLSWCPLRNAVFVGPQTPRARLVWTLVSCQRIGACRNLLQCFGVCPLGVAQAPLPHQHPNDGLT